MSEAKQQHEKEIKKLNDEQKDLNDKITMSNKKDAENQNKSKKYEEQLKLLKDENARRMMVIEELKKKNQMFNSDASKNKTEVIIYINSRNIKDGGVINYKIKIILY